MNCFDRHIFSTLACWGTLVAATLVAGCDANPLVWKIPNMTTLSPRLQSIFQNTKTVCFGRFMVDVPEATHVAWGEADVPLNLWVIKDRAGDIKNRVSEKETHLKSEIRFPRTQGLTLYFETVVGALPGMRHIVSQRDAGSDNLLRINSYFAMGNDLVAMEALPMANDKTGTIEELNDMARRLRPRAEAEVPTEPGTCIEDAFLAEAPGAKPEDINEHIRIGFRLKEFPDVHLSIFAGPANSMDWSLDQQLQITEERARKAGRPAPYQTLTIFRRSKRELPDWKTGFELLTRTPDEEGSHAHHDFWMKVTGTVNDPLRPFMDIDFKTGVGENAAGAVKPSLTDEEAIALWDKLTGSIRVRPTSKRTSQAATPKTPLGNLQVSGRTCPQTGWWECDDPLPLAQPSSGVWLEEGQRMPMARVWLRPSWWQQWKGERPVGQRAAMWRLAAYDAPPAAATPKKG